MALVMAAPVKHPRSSLLWFRRGTPRDILRNMGRLRAMGLAVTREVKQSLGTRDPREAKLLQAQLSAQWDERWQEWRRLLEDGPRVLTQKEVFAIAAEVAEGLLAKHEDNPGAPQDWTEWDEGAIHHRLYGTDRAIAACHAAIDARLSANGLVVAPESRAAIIVQFNDKDRWQLYKVLQKRASGDYSESAWLKARPKVDFKADASAIHLTFKALLEVWRKEPREYEPRARTVGAYGRILDELAEFLKHSNAATVTDDDVRRYLEWLDGKGLAVKTRRDRLTALKAIFQAGVVAKKLAGNPAKDVRFKKGPKAKAKRRAFTPEEAALILIATREEKGFKRWAPWLMAYSGMRVEEAGQIRKADVRTLQGRHYVWLTDAAGHVKNRQDRIVPLHPAVIAEGFMEFVERCKTERLFPEASIARDGKQKDGGSGLLGRWIRKRLKIDDASVPPNHGWRHWFKRFCENNGVVAEARRLIEGRSEGLTEEQYGTNDREEWLAKEIEKLPAIISSQGEKHA